jgi:hypothetical protein
MNEMLNVQWQENINDVGNLVFVETVIKLLDDKVGVSQLEEDITYIVVPQPAKDSDVLIQEIESENRNDVNKTGLIRYGYKNRGLAIPFLDHAALTINLSRFFEYGAENLAVLAVDQSLNTLAVKEILEYIMLGDEKCNAVESRSHYVVLYFEDNVLTEII